MWLNGMKPVHRCTLFVEKETLKVDTDGDLKEQTCVWLVAGKCAYQKRLSTVQALLCYRAVATQICHA